MSWTELAQAVAAEFGLRLTSEHADHLLWERTGFPSFWRTDDPVMECSNQLRSSFRRSGFDRLRPLRAYSARLHGGGKCVLPLPHVGPCRAAGPAVPGEGTR